MTYIKSGRQRWKQKLPIVNDIRELCLSRNSRALGLDYGDKRVGVAVSDTGFSIASPLIVLDSHNVFDMLFKIIDEYNVSVIVIGKPITLCGESGGKQLEKVVKFAEKLLLIRDMSVIMWDERFSTHAAVRYMSQTNISLNKQNKLKDKLSASFILQGVLDLFNLSFV